MDMILSFMAGFFVGAILATVVWRKNAARFDELEKELVATKDALANAAKTVRKSL